MKELLRTEYEKGRADAIAEISKQEWSENDKKMLNDTFDILSSYYSSTDDVVLCDNINKAENWLKTLKDKIQPKQEWSDDDERLFQIVIDILDRENHLGNMSHTDLIACVRKLKSLRLQKQWKPSDEQMKQLGWIAKQNKDNMIGKELMSLYNDLKKEREELL